MSKILAIFVFISIIASLIISRPIKKTISPQASVNLINHQLSQNLTYKNLTATNIDIDIYNQKIYFTLIDNNKFIPIILSTQKQIPLQINVLQKIIKTVRINLAYPTIIDLSLEKPYATIKNN